MRQSFGTQRRAWRPDRCHVPEHVTPALCSVLPRGLPDRSRQVGHPAADRSPRHGSSRVQQTVALTLNVFQPAPAFDIPLGGGGARQGVMVHHVCYKSAANWSLGIALALAMYVEL